MSDFSEADGPCYDPNPPKPWQVHGRWRDHWGTRCYEIVDRNEWLPRWLGMLILRLGKRIHGWPDAGVLPR